MFELKYTAFNLCEACGKYHWFVQWSTKDQLKITVQFSTIQWLSCHEIHSLKLMISTINSRIIKFTVYLCKSFSHAIITLPNIVSWYGVDNNCFNHFAAHCGEPRASLEIKSGHNSSLNTFTKNGCTDHFWGLKAVCNR